MTVSRAKRKIDHIQHALKTGQLRENGFDDVMFLHQSLPDTAVHHIDLHTEIGELVLSSPIFINAMTGGGGMETVKINEALSTAAAECGIPLAVGSQMSAIRDASERPSYEVVRKVNQKGFLFANLGSEATPDQAKTAIDMIEANAIQIHLNVVQELVMPEGDRDFSGALKRISAIAEASEVPVIVKEVGFGMNREAAEKLRDAGVTAIDVGGFGGTNFAKIENERRSRLLSYFNDWGIPTAVSIAELKSSVNGISILGSGGIQNAMDIAKAISLGASSAGIAGFFLKILIEDGYDALVSEIKNVQNDLRMIMTALGAGSISQLQNAPIILSGLTHHILNERKVDTKFFSNRMIEK
jgi:isopentenyl-diphosphate delta-isomerase